MKTVLRVAMETGDSLDAATLRVQGLDKAIIFDKIEVDAAGLGSVLYDRLCDEVLRAELVSYSDGLKHK